MVEELTQDFLRLTPVAVQYLQGLQMEEPKTIGFALSLKKAGCAGYMYKLDPVLSMPKKSVPFAVDGVTFYVDEESIPRLSGSILDYKVDNLETKAVFINPNVTEACGCGDSVDIKKTGA